jgi:hypothetical protein
MRQRSEFAKRVSDARIMAACTLVNLWWLPSFIVALVLCVTVARSSLAAAALAVASFVVVAGLSRFWLWIELRRVRRLIPRG